MPELEELPELPPEYQYIWEWFWQLAQGRGSNGFGLNPLSYLEIASWAQLNAVELLPWEAKALRTIDACYLHSQKDA